MIKITLPIYWTQHFKTKKDKTVLVGMNWYRNAFYIVQNKMKQKFSGLVEDQLDGTRIQGPYTLHIDLYYKNPTCDGSNIVALMEKVALDALQHNKAVEQDNVLFHLGTTWNVAGRDKENPRCEISILAKQTGDNKC
ncbi:hypothetical protein AD45P2_00570 [Alteromonas phage vB_AmaP_AD45-P2]|uniref:Uncharacterized protein n=2 Tax=Pseudomonadota TaxID=1224 RepID=A0A922T8U9_9HYPH|nr:hypothetical protein [Pseudorhizobium pelagicum]YP_008126083.1 RusA-like Holliday junction resolvase [Alteromonas phage vB_AmaP_AD45-P1]AGM47047.1 hypothetical protein AD45P3_00545 [Alteromonas phage vB_AmaP_AD45-P3]AGM47163.1 hypothetical protein AD45P4_00540 [Alteromonas phage vB_AmaP_AD45-P4]AGM47285.1 hypothetical protein AD45P2_00570 [Alteromonas phage vB_AmaP_AD45-P2]AGM46930.1 hypothetical protein AD45P1_00560 [Alteromonas phage vB_AmaP_AD45-P1]KEQ05597.1 hypothetical protein GV68_0